MTNQIQQIERLEILAKRAANQLLAGARRLIPVGSRVSYQMQRLNRKFRIYGEVTGHGVHGSRATFIVANEATGKFREVTISAWDLRVEADHE